MDNLSAATSSFRASITAAKRPHTWVISFLYIGTFGSFIGFSAAFPLLIKTTFPEVAGVQLAFLGALVGSVSRPFGGKLADLVGGAWVTVCAFVVMGVGILSAIVSLNAGSFAGFLISFLVLFVASGAGNGSTYRMIPAVFRSTTRDLDGGVGPGPGPARGGGVHRDRLGDRRVRRVPGAARLRDVERRVRIAGAGAVLLLRVLRRVPARHVLLLPAQGWSTQRGARVTATHCPYCALQCAMTLSPGACRW